MTVFGRFWRFIVDHIAPRKWSLCFDNFPNVSYHFCIFPHCYPMCPASSCLPSCSFFRCFCFFNSTFSSFHPLSCHTHNRQHTTHTQYTHFLGLPLVFFSSVKPASAMKSEYSDMCTCNRPLSCEWFEQEKKTRKVVNSA